MTSREVLFKMRIAYVAPYQGQHLRRCRPIVANLMLAANLKIELIAELLQTKGHHVEILSQGEPGERRFRLYPQLQELQHFHPKIPVYYCSALPVRFLTGFWSTWQMLRLVRRRHREAPFDLVIIYNFKRPQSVAGLYAKRWLGRSVILEYEDDALVDIAGNMERSLGSAFDRSLLRRVLKVISGCMGASPHLLAQAPSGAPQVLLRGLISAEIMRLGEDASRARNNWVVFSGTHFRSKGLPQLIAAWKLVHLPGWQLHVAGYGELTLQLRAAAAGDASVVFHGLLNREQNARLLTQAKIGINPHELSRTPGNVFAFKIIEYLAAGVHVITTPMGFLEPELEHGVTYVPDNRPETIAASLMRVIKEREFERHATHAARRLYGPEAVAVALDTLLGEAIRPTRSSAAASGC